ncbi:hypothetical protein [Capnocytophaga leadbetteri]|uniref:hypothetical protein n=1 Tax=Capnocytophaga leadbetteri TaxID=327575 RepID=UPI0028E45E54|nr:hypothetical protein [Capnocytophaga leadbetteri]
MKEQVTTLEVGKCYRVKYDSINWYIKIYEKNIINDTLTLLWAIEVGSNSINTRCCVFYENKPEYKAQEISNSEFLHEFRTKRNEINKLIRKMS